MYSIPPESNQAKSTKTQMHLYHNREATYLHCAFKRVLPF